MSGTDSSLIVRQGGMHTTLQDRGRFGAQALGVPVSGALDPEMLWLANALVGNAPDEAALDLYLGGLGERLQTMLGIPPHRPLLLPAPLVEVLREIPLSIKKRHADHRHSEIGTGLQGISSENTEPAGIGRHA